MACRWLNPQFAGTVEQARNYRVYSVIDGSTWWYPRDVMNYIYDNVQTSAYWWDFTGATYQGYVNTIIDKIRTGHIAISCLNMSNITVSTNSNFRTDCYYQGSRGHYLLIKGYRIVDGVVWLQVHDPWGLGLRYDDGTRVGENRYYRALEVAKTIDWNIWTIMIPYNN